MRAGGGSGWRAVHDRGVDTAAGVSAAQGLPPSPPPVCVTYDSAETAGDGAQAPAAPAASVALTLKQLGQCLDAFVARCDGTAAVAAQGAALELSLARLDTRELEEELRLQLVPRILAALRRLYQEIHEIQDDAPAQAVAVVWKDSLIARYRQVPRLTYARARASVGRASACPRAPARVSARPCDVTCAHGPGDAVDAASCGGCWGGGWSRRTRCAGEAHKKNQYTHTHTHTHTQ